jgi:hypothetical protein
MHTSGHASQCTDRAVYTPGDVPPYCPLLESNVGRIGAQDVTLVMFAPS